MSVATYTKTGAKATSPAKLNKDVFNVEVNSHELVRLAYEGFNQDVRRNLAKTLRRGEVRGGGRKPWRQKGTGRARFGSTRNPIWTGGGIVFGPLGNENYTTKLNKKAKSEAMRQALSLKNISNKLVVIESLPTSGKTAELAKLVDKLGAKGSVVLVDATKNDSVGRAVANLANVSLLTSSYLNVRRVLDADLVVLTSKAVEALEARLAGK
ncbi:50S ribosomal protein L4 [Candidatus Saccharibacteria bacterium]|nr:50S ribosomal protein L4 [Candidatus Saccharibacteria bacterium]MCB9821556.1 50S ribosomal protein L4 [Candidatus Nomurabacteria bacterium]